MLFFNEIIHLPFTFFIILSGIVGLLVGSFLNVVIVRLPIMMQRQEEWFIWQYQQEKKSEAIKPCLSIPSSETAIPEQLRSPYSLYAPASHCPRCKAKVKWWMNIPVVSYIGLKGRCHTCKVAIAIQYPLVEVAASLLAISAALFWDGDATSRMTACAMMVFLWALLALTVIDFNTQYLPDAIVLPLLWLGLIVNMLGITQIPLSSAVWGAIAGYMSLFSVCYLFKYLTKKQGMGHGDFKLLAALGAWLGVQMILPIILLSSVVGSIIGIYLLSKRRMNTQNYMAFGPYLAIAGGICAFYGEYIINYYWSYANL